MYWGFASFFIQLVSFFSALFFQDWSTNEYNTTVFFYNFVANLY
jgi:hypothetical protein